MAKKKKKTGNAAGNNGESSGPLYELQEIDDALPGPTEELRTGLETQLNLISTNDPESLRTRLRAVEEYFSVEFFSPENPEDVAAHDKIKAEKRHNVLLGINHITPLETYDDDERDEALVNAWEDAKDSYDSVNEANRVLVLNKQQAGKDATLLGRHLGSNPAIWMNLDAHYVVDYMHTSLLDQKQKAVVANLQAVESRSLNSGLKRKLDDFKKDREREKKQHSEELSKLQKKLRATDEKLSEAHQTELAKLKGEISEIKRAAGFDDATLIDRDLPVDSGANRWIDVRMRDLGKLADPGGLIPRDPDMALLMTTIDTEPPLYVSSNRRFLDRLQLVNFAIHGGDLKNDATIISDNRIEARHGAQRNELFRMAFAWVYSIRPQDAGHVVNALKHPDEETRKLAESHEHFIDKFVYARCREWAWINRLGDSSADKIPDFNRVTATNNLYVQYVNDFVEFCRSPETAAPSLIQGMHSRRKACYDDMRTWRKVPHQWDYIGDAAVHQQVNSFWPKPEIANVWAYQVPP